MTILLIEPDITLANIYIQAFSRNRIKVLHSRGAQDAIKLADHEKPDLVIMELQLAAHSGSAFLYEFRSYADWLNVPIIVNTLIPPDKLKVYEKSLRELGVQAWLYKPQTSLEKMISVALSYVGANTI